MKVKTVFILVLLITLSLCMMLPTTSAVQYNGNKLGHDNISWWINCTNDFNTIATSSDGYIRLNDIYFYINSANPLSLSLNHFQETTTDGDRLCSFTATSTGGTAWFTITGLHTGGHYQILMDSSNIGTPEATTGSITFNCDSWSTHTFEVFQYAEDSGSGSPGGGGWGDDMVWCYQCQQGELVYERFNGDSCPDGWYDHPPDCNQQPLDMSGDGLSYDDVGLKIFIILLMLFVLFILARGKTYKKFTRYVKPKPSIYWLVFIIAVLLLLVFFGDAIAGFLLG